MKAKMEMKQPGMPVRQSPVCNRDGLQVATPFPRRPGEIDRTQRSIGDLTKQFFLGTEVMQHRHWIDAHSGADLADGKAFFTNLVDQRKGRFKDR